MVPWCRFRPKIVGLVGAVVSPGWLLANGTQLFVFERGYHKPACKRKAELPPAFLLVLLLFASPTSPGIIKEFLVSAIHHSCVAKREVAVKQTPRQALVRLHVRGITHFGLSLRAGVRVVRVSRIHRIRSSITTSVSSFIPALTFHARSAGLESCCSTRPRFQTSGRSGENALTESGVAGIMLALTDRLQAFCRERSPRSAR